MSSRVAIVVAVLSSCITVHVSSNVVRGFQWHTPTHSDGAGMISKRGLLTLRGGSTAIEPELKGRLEQLLQSSHVMLFMKGTPEKPQCGFSNQIVALLKSRNIQFKSFNIFEDEEVRQGLKIYSNWPTYPQLYAGGTLIGGLDVVKELIELGELENELKLKRDDDKTTPGNSGEKDSLQKITESTLKEKIQVALKAQFVRVQDLSDGCGAKFSVLVVSALFEGQPLIERQRSIYALLESEMKHIHALTLKCLTPAQYQP